jgi:sugar lactone lactonase YvrE
MHRTIFMRSNVIRKFTPDGTAATITVTVPGNRFLYAQGIAADNSGNLYVISLDGVKRISQTGVMTPLAAAPIPRANAGATVDVRFSPAGISIDRQNNLYAAYYSAGETLIQKITPQGTVSTVLAYTGDGVSSGEHLAMPKGIAMTDPKTIAITVDNGVFLLHMP